MSVSLASMPLLAARPRWGARWWACAVMALDVLWNVMSGLAAAAVVARSFGEAPRAPLRLWAAGYALQCLLHAACVIVEQSAAAAALRGRVGLSVETDGDAAGISSLAKHLESATTAFSFLWWIIGFYWVSIGGQPLTKDAPQLYWLCVVLLAFDVFFAVFCIALACIVGVAVCCCLPCIMTILYALLDEEGATDEGILQLPKYKFSSICNQGDLYFGTCTFAGVMTESETDQPIQNALYSEDAECCICLSAYEDGAELLELPCSHHFHRACIHKWLRINTSCPLCKCSIIQAYHGGLDEV